VGDPPRRFLEGGKFGFRSPDGRVVAEPRFEDAWEFKEGLARVKLGGRWGFLDGEGRVVVEPQFDYAWDFSGGKAKVRLPGGTVRYVDREGKPVE
jgi:hypothetical protein